MSNSYGAVPCQNPPADEARTGANVMAFISSRKKLVTFRLSSEEYEALKKYCISSGARSVSDFARETILERISQTKTPRSILSSDLMMLSSSLEEIDAALKDLSGRISKVLGPR
jgi:hypothetical protein